jgi:hypothetical protein
VSVKCNCYACRNYFSGCLERTHKALLWAKHKDGAFWWGKKAPGLWVRICRSCRDELSSEVYVY